MLELPEMQFVHDTCSETHGQLDGVNLTTCLIKHVMPQASWQYPGQACTCPQIVPSFVRHPAGYLAGRDSLPGSALHRCWRYVHAVTFGLVGRHPSDHS